MFISNRSYSDIKFTVILGKVKLNIPCYINDLMLLSLLLCTGGFWEIISRSQGNELKGSGHSQARRTQWGSCCTTRLQCYGRCVPHASCHWWNYSSRSYEGMLCPAEITATPDKLETIPMVNLNLANVTNSCYNNMSIIAMSLPFGNCLLRSQKLLTL